MVFGVGPFTQGVMQALRCDGAHVSAYLTRDYGHYGPSLEGRTYAARRYPSPIQILRREKPAWVLPMAIEWALQPWTPAFLASGVPILCPTGEGLRLERERDYGRDLCRRFGVPYPRSHLAADRREALAILRRRPRAYVIKNPLCSPFSPLHTIVCETAADTRAWLERVDDSEGVFLQEYLGRAEVGHVAFVSAGSVFPMVTNQEYKRAWDGNQGIVAGAPLGGLVERDPGDKYRLVRQLIAPLLPWFREVNYHGPIQVTAARHQGKWHVLEYNVRLGITTGPLLLRMLANPLEVLSDVIANRPLRARFRPERRFGCSLTLAGYGYPYVSLSGPRLPVDTTGRFTTPMWWGEVAVDRAGRLYMTGHRIADVIGTGPTLRAAVARAYRNIRRIRCLGSYYRRDVGESLWPPGAK